MFNTFTVNVGSPSECMPLLGAWLKMALDVAGSWPWMSSKSVDEDSPWLYLSIKPYEFDKARVRELYGGGKKQL